MSTGVLALSAVVLVVAVSIAIILLGGYLVEKIEDRAIDRLIERRRREHDDT